MEEDFDVFAEYWDAVERTAGEGNFVLSTVLLSEVRRKLKNENLGPDMAWYKLLDLCHNLGINSIPFSGEEAFRRLYDFSERLPKVDWDGAFIRQFDSSRAQRVPAPVMSLFDKRLESGTKKVVIAEAEKFFPGVKNTCAAHPDTKFVLTTGSEVYFLALRSATEGCENVEVTKENIFGKDFHLNGFDLVFSFPAMGTRALYDGAPADVFALENLLSNLNPDARLVMAVSGRLTYSQTGDIAAIRKRIEKNYRVEEIGELPGGVLPFTGVKTYLLDIVNARPGDEKSVFVRKYEPAGGRKGRFAPVCDIVTGEEMALSQAELSAQGDWNVAKMFSQRSGDFLEYMRSPVRKVRLSEVAKIFRGKAVFDRDEGGNIAVLSISNLGEFGVTLEGAEKIEADETGRISSYLLKKGDLLLPARGTTLRTAIFEGADIPCIASANLLVIRALDSSTEKYPVGEDGERLPALNTAYLKIFLDSEIGKKLVEGTQQGAALMNISHNDFGALEIPLPSEKEQKEKADEYASELEKYKSAVMDAEKKWKEALERLQKF